MLKSLFNQFDSIIVLDTETTGFNSQSDEIIELAALKIVPDGDSYRVAGEFDHLIKLSEQRKLPSVITELTGISQEMLNRDGVSKQVACDAFLELLGDDRALIVAYNAQFDLCFLYYFLARFRKARILKQVKMLDAMAIYKDRREFPHKLSDAINAYSLNAENTHRAIDDAKATFELLLAMAAEEQDIDKYINLFGYNPKYGVSGRKISSVTYREQDYKDPRKLYEIEDLS